MSTLYLGSDPRSLADKLADELDRSAKAGDFFAPVRIVVPNRYLRKWLRLYLARKLDVAINLEFQSLEDALWKLLQEVEPDTKAAAPDTLDENIYRLMVLSVLLGEKVPDLALLDRYLQREGPALSRLSCRRAWRLADRFGLLIRDYEYARQDMLIQRWLAGKFGLADADPFQQTMERAQRAIFQAITKEPAGKRATLNRNEEKNYKTFPQYAMERMESAKAQLRPDTPVHFFGFTEVSALHARTIAWLGRCFDVRFYHLNVLANRLAEPLHTAADGFRAPSDAETTDRGRELMRLWGRAGAESLDLLAPLTADAPFNVEILPMYPAPKRPAKSSVLARLRDHLLGNKPVKQRVPQDTSLQIVGCPGVAREVETVFQSIVHNLQSDPALRQTDIAVLVTDMSKYRATLQAVFERPPQRVQYNMVDFSAASASTFGQALVGMLDLALESFARSRVFAVLLNPCFLARLGVDRAQAMTWLDWAESLGICHGWDADEKAKQGYADSPLYSWRLGLQRLRLGRYMEVTSEDADGPAARFGHVIPFADLGSTDRDQLDAFCRAVEGLLPALAKLRDSSMNGKNWANVLRGLVKDYLDVPADRAEEAQVRADVLRGIDKLASWDALHDSSRQATGLPLALVREFVQTQLGSIPGNRGEFLVGGVTIAQMQPMCPVPFAIVYVLGLGEDLFPGSNALSSLDLRSAARLPGDIRPAEARLYDFLATVLSADKKLYLLHNNHDLQRDQELQPAVPIAQLVRFLNDNVLKSEFQSVAMPSHADDVRYLDPAQQPAYQDVLVQPAAAERCLAVLAAKRDNRLELDTAQEAEWSRHWAALRKNFVIPPAPPEPTSAAVNVSLTELRRFLRLPAQESLRRHLRIEEEDEREVEDDEPLVTTDQAANFLVRLTIQQLIRDAAQTGVKPALASWKGRFAQIYDDAQLRSRAPEKAFGEIDKAAIEEALNKRIHEQGRIEAFLHERAGSTFCGPVLLGSSYRQIGPKLRFPALRIRVESAAQEIHVFGSTNLAWHDAARFEILILSNSEKIDGDKLHSALFEPALLHLALLANAKPNDDGIASQAWLAKREFLLHVAHQNGIQTWSYPPGSITPAEATAYLTKLTNDFLQPGEFDLLPFDLLIGKPELRLALQESATLQIAPADYRNLLIESVEDLRENTFSINKIPPLVEMIRAEVPADALAKVQRRFRLLDRGPARFRTQPRVSKGKRAAKP